MTVATPARPRAARRPSLTSLLDPEVLANPYPLFARLREETPVGWDPYLHAWVVTRYPDVMRVLQSFSAARTPTPEHLESLGLGALTPIARVMIHQVIFLDPPAHGRVRGITARAFTPRRVEALRAHIWQIAEALLDAAAPRGRMDVLPDYAYLLPAIVTAELVGVPEADRERMYAWSDDFAGVLGNFQHDPDHAARVVASIEAMCDYFRWLIRARRADPRDDLTSALIAVEADGAGLSEEEMIANLILLGVAGQETTTNLITTGVLTLLRHPEALAALRADPARIPAAVEEMLRFESPSQHTARLAPEDLTLGGQAIRKGQAVIAVIGAANRDPDRFPDPDRFDPARPDNRHLAFGWASHFCFGAPLARLEGQIAIEALIRRFPALALAPGPLTWRENLGLRGLTGLPVTL